MDDKTKEKLSEAMSGRHSSPETQFTSEKVSGENNPRWNGGTWRMTNGYVMVLKPGHPRAGKRGYLYEHILVACEKYGRLIELGEVVHHIDGDRSNNHPDNLIVFPNNGSHLKHHAEKRKKDYS